MIDFVSMYGSAAVWMLAAGFVTYRVMLLLHPGVRRWRASKDLAYAYALEQFRAHYRAQLKQLRAEFGIEKESGAE